MSNLMCACAQPELPVILPLRAGVRQNNASAKRSCRNGSGKKGYAFFADDEDEFGLASLLQALLFYETGRTSARPQPWELAAGVAGGPWVGGTEGSRCIQQEPDLPTDVQQQLRWLRGAAKDDV
jgi:hypothetical protein